MSNPNPTVLAREIVGCFRSSLGKGPMKTVAWSRRQVNQGSELITSWVCGKPYSVPLSGVLLTHVQDIFARQTLLRRLTHLPEQRERWYRDALSRAYTTLSPSSKGDLPLQQDFLEEIKANGSHPEAQL